MRELNNLVYISGAISSNNNFAVDFENAEMWLKLKGFVPINPTRLNALIPFLSYENYMKIDYKLLELSDVIFMLDGWQNSKGACAELAYAKTLGKKVMYQDYFNDFKKVRTNEHSETVKV